MTTQTRQSAERSGRAARPEVRVVPPPARLADDLVLDIRELSVQYGYGEKAVQALKGVSLQLGRGEILGLAGESGCGKSTLAYAATRLLPPPGVITGGEVLFRAVDGQEHELLSLSDNELRAVRWSDLAIVFQGAMNSLNPVYRISRQILDAIQVHRPTWSSKQRQDRAKELMQLVGIPSERLRAFPHQLSGGMRQRVMIAMALALEPQILIMDEPTTALDVVMQRQIVEQIVQLRDRMGFSVIFITHDVSLLIEIADRIAIMYAGEIIEQGPAEELYRRPRHPYTRGLLNSFPPLKGPKTELTGIPGSPPDLANLPTGCKFHPRCPFAMEKCVTNEPVLQISPAKPEPGRTVACWLHEAEALLPEVLSR